MPTMIVLVALAFCCAIANAMLAATQHSALMALYDAIGCPASTCIRFPSDSDCPLSSDLTCREPDVIGM